MAEGRMRAGASASFSGGGGGGAPIGGTARQLKELAAQLSKAEINSAVFGRSFDQAKNKVAAFSSSLKGLIAETAKLSGDPLHMGTVRLLEDFRKKARAVARVREEVQKLEKAYSEQRSKATQQAKDTLAALESQRQKARKLGEELKGLHSQLKKFRTEGLNFGSRGAADVAGRKNMAQMLWQDRSLQIQQKAMGGEQSLGGQLRMVNLELQRYENLKRAGFTTDSKRAQQMGFTAAKVRELRGEQDRLNRTIAKAEGGAVSGGGTKGGWMGGAVQQIKYWGRLRLFYGIFNKLRAGLGAFVDIEGGVNRAVRTAVSNVNDYNEVMRARIEIQNAATAYLSKHLGTIQEYTEAVHQLTQAEMERSQAVKVAPVIMAAAKGLDAPITDMTRLMVGLNELFRDRIKGMETDSQRITHMASVMAVAVKKEVTSIEQITRSLGYVAPIAKIANMSFEEMIATIATLHTNLMLASRAGTGMRQMINAIAKNADKLNAAFNLQVDMDKPLAFAEFMGRLGDQLGNGALSLGRIKEALGAFQLRGAPSAIILAEQFKSVRDLARDLRGAKLEDLLGMRDIMEKNVPAQLKILSNNLDLLMANFMRGAVGGNDFAEVLEKINGGMLPLHRTMLAFGKTVNVVFGNRVTVSILALAGAYMLLRKQIWAVVGAQGMMKKMAAFGAGGWITAALGAVTMAVYMYQRHKMALDEQIASLEESIEKRKAEAMNLRETAEVMEDAAMTEERIVGVKEKLARAAEMAGVAIDTQSKSVENLKGKVLELADAEDRLIKIEARELSKKRREKLTSRIKTIEPYMAYRGNVDAVEAGITPVRHTVFSQLKRNVLRSDFKGMMSEIDGYIASLVDSGMGPEEVKKNLNGLVGPVLSIMKDYQKKGTMAIKNGAGKFTEEYAVEAQTAVNKLSAWIDLLASKLSDPFAKATAEIKKQRKEIEETIAGMDEKLSNTLWKITGGALRGIMTGATVKSKGGEDRSLRGNEYIRYMRMQDMKEQRMQMLVDRLRGEFALGDVQKGLVDNFGDDAGGRMLRAIAGGIDRYYGNRDSAEKKALVGYLRENFKGLLDNPKFREFGVAGLADTAAGRRDRWALKEPDFYSRLWGESSDTQKLIDEYRKGQEELRKNTEELSKLNANLAGETGGGEAAAPRKSRREQKLELNEWYARERRRIEKGKGVNSPEFVEHQKRMLRERYKQGKENIYFRPAIAETKLNPDPQGTIGIKKRAQIQGPRDPMMPSRLQDHMKRDVLQIRLQVADGPMKEYFLNNTETLVESVEVLGDTVGRVNGIIKSTQKQLQRMKETRR